MKLMLTDHISLLLCLQRQCAVVGLMAWTPVEYYKKIASPIAKLPI